jgi:hypothetical protein
MQRIRERKARQIELEKEKQSNKYKSDIFISNKTNEEAQNKFIKELGLTADELSMQHMNKDNTQLFEHRKYIWDNKTRKYKKLKVSMSGKIIREDGQHRIINEQIKNRFSNWRKSTNLNFQKEGDTEIRS